MFCDLVHMALACDLTRVGVAAVHDVPVAHERLRADRAELRPARARPQRRSRQPGHAGGQQGDRVAHEALRVPDRPSCATRPRGRAACSTTCALVFLHEGGHGLDTATGKTNSTHSTENMACLIAGRAGGIKGGLHVAATGKHPANVLDHGDERGRRAREAWARSAGTSRPCSAKRRRAALAAPWTVWPAPGVVLGGCARSPPYSVAARSPRRWRGVRLAAISGLVACEGKGGAHGQGAGGSGATGGAGVTGTGGPTGAAATPAPAGARARAEAARARAAARRSRPRRPRSAPVPSNGGEPGVTPLAKLSTLQYRNTVRDLLARAACPRSRPRWRRCSPRSPTTARSRSAGSTRASRATTSRGTSTSPTAVGERRHRHQRAARRRWPGAAPGRRR